MAKKKGLRVRVQGSKQKLRIPGTVARDLGLQIVSGRFKPGHHLENEIEASERLGVSRSAYREAVRILGAKGLVNSKPKIGTRVSAPEDWQLLDPDVLSWLFEYDPDEKLLADLFELRKMVEPMAAELAANRRSGEQLERMRHALADMGKYTLATEEGRAADREFHSILLEASNNAFLTTLTSGIAAAINWTTVFKQRDTVTPRDALPDHEQVFAAVASRNSKRARKAMFALVELAFADTQRSRRRRRSVA